MDDNKDSESCGNCICFLAQGKTTIQGIGEVVTGGCRLNPPVPVPITTTTVPKKIIGPADQQAMDLNLRIEPIYPPVHSGLWCRNHLTREEYPYFKLRTLGMAEDADPNDMPPVQQ